MRAICIIVLFIVAQKCHSLLLKSNEIYTTCVQSGAVTNVELSGCEKTPCPLKRGATVNITINFQTDTKIQDLRMNIFAVAGGIKFPFMSARKSCSKEKYNIECPLQPNEPLEFRDRLYVKKFYPPWRLDVVVELYGAGTYGNVACVEVPVRIV